MADDLKRVLFRLEGEGKSLISELQQVKKQFFENQKESKKFNDSVSQTTKSVTQQYKEQEGAVNKLRFSISQLEQARDKSNNPALIQKYNSLLDQQRTKLTGLTSIHKEEVQVIGIVNNLIAKQNALVKARDESKNIQQVKQLNKEIEQTSAQLAKLQNQKAGGIFGGSGGLGGIIAGAAGGFGILGIVNGLKTLGKTAFDQSIAFETTKISFETMLGSGQAAEKFLGDLVDFAAKTPFELPELQGASRNLLAFGFSAKETIPVLKQLGDVAAGTNQPIGELAFLYGKARSLTIADNEILQQFAQRGIPVYDILAKKFDTNTLGVKKLAEQSKITFANLQEAFDSLTVKGGKFFNLTEKLSQSTAGRIATLTDNFHLFLQALGDEGKPVLDGVIDRVGELLENLDPKKFIAVISTIGTLLKLFIVYKTTLFATSLIQKIFNKEGIVQNLLFAARNFLLDVQTKGLVAATRAQLAFNNAGKANPFGLIAGIIAVVIAYFIDFNKILGLTADKVTVLTKANALLADGKKLLAETTQLESQAIGEEVGKLNILFGALKQTTNGSKERKEIIDQINATYGTTLKNLEDEEAFVLATTAAYNLLKDSILKAARAKAVNSKIEQLSQLEFDTKFERENLKVQQDLLVKSQKDRDKIIEVDRQKRIKQQNLNTGIIPEVTDPIVRQALNDNILLGEIINKRELLNQQVLDVNEKIKLASGFIDLDELLKGNDTKTPTKGKKAKDLSGDLDKLIEQLIKLREEKKKFDLEDQKGLSGLKARLDLEREILGTQLSRQELEVKAKFGGTNLEVQALALFNEIRKQSFANFDAERQKQIDEFNQKELEKAEELNFKMRQNELITIKGGEDNLLLALEERYARERLLAERNGELTKELELDIEQRKQQEIIDLKAQFTATDFETEIKTLDLLEQTKLSKIIGNTQKQEKERAAIQLKFAQARLELAKKELSDLVDLEDETGGNVALTKQIEDLQDKIQQLENALNKPIKANGLQQVAKVLKDITTITDAVINGIREIIKVQQQRTDFEIEQQQKRVDAATTLAEKGNAEILEQEQKRMEKLLAERKKQVAAQKALDAIQFVSSSVVAIANAAAQGGGFASIATVAAVIGAIAGGIALVSSIAQGFKGGVVDLDGPGTGTSDSIPARLSKGESVTTAEKTKASKQTLSAIRDGKFTDMDFKAWKKQRRFEMDFDKLSLTKFSRRVVFPNKTVQMIQARFDVGGIHSRLEQLDHSIKNIEFPTPVMNDKGVFHLSEKGKKKTNRILNRP